MTMHNPNVKRHRHISFWATPLSPVVGGTIIHEWLMRMQDRYLRALSLHVTRVWLVQSISIARIFTTLLFIALAFKNVSLAFLSCLYGFAMVSDLIDGYVSRKLKAETYFGKVVDLVADKSLTTVSLLYAAARGIDVLPIALIATRDIIMIGMRLVSFEGTQLLPTSRIFGGIMVSLLWGNTLVLIYARTGGEVFQVVNVIYWGCALIFVINLLARLNASAARIKMAPISNQLSESIVIGSHRECRCNSEPLTSTGTASEYDTDTLTGS